MDSYALGLIILTLTVLVAQFIRDHSRCATPVLAKANALHHCHPDLGRIAWWTRHRFSPAGCDCIPRLKPVRLRTSDGGWINFNATWTPLGAPLKPGWVIGQCCVWPNLAVAFLEAPENKR